MSAWRPERLSQLYAPGTTLAETQPCLPGMRWEVWLCEQITDQARAYQAKLTPEQRAAIEAGAKHISWRREWRPADSYGM